MLQDIKKTKINKIFGVILTILILLTTLKDYSEINVNFISKKQTSFKNLYKSDKKFEDKINSKIISDVLIFSPLVASFLKKNPYFYLTYSASVLSAKTFIYILNNNKQDKTLNSVPVGIIGSIGIFKLVGSTLFSNLAIIPFLYCFGLEIATGNLSLNHLLINVIISIISLLICFKIENFSKSRLRKPLLKKGPYRKKFRKF